MRSIKPAQRVTELEQEYFEYTTPHPWTELEKALIGELTGDLEIIPQPFLPLAERLGLSHRRPMIRRLQEDDVIRRFGATLRHRNSGFEANAMAVWSPRGPNREHWTNHSGFPGHPLLS